MRLSEHSLGIEWLGQFDKTRDIHAARLLLDSLKLVSFSAFEHSISKLIEAVCTRTEGIIAAFDVNEKIIDPSSKPGSSGRLAHALTNLGRQFPDRLLVTPTIEEMRANNVKHILLVDDFVGSGKRVRDFWDAWPSPTLKSWLSYGYCELWLVGYAIHESGTEVVMDRITYLQSDHMCFEVRLTAAETFWPSGLRELAEQYADRTEIQRYPLGFGDIMGPIVFQHGCPDNCPAILWNRGKTWRPMFPSRAIPAALYPCFQEENDSGRGPRLLWQKGQHRLAFSLLNSLDQLSGKREYRELLILLGLLLKGISAENLSIVMTTEASRIKTLLSTALELGLIDAAAKVTPFGHDIVERSRKTFLINPKQIVSSTAKGTNYVPKQFRRKICGVQ